MKRNHKVYSLYWNVYLTFRMFLFLINELSFNATDHKTIRFPCRNIHQPTTLPTPLRRYLFTDSSTFLFLLDIFVNFRLVSVSASLAASSSPRRSFTTLLRLISWFSCGSGNETNWNKSELKAFASKSIKFFSLSRQNGLFKISK